MNVLNYSNKKTSCKNQKIQTFGIILKRFFIGHGYINHENSRKKKQKSIGCNKSKISIYFIVYRANCTKQ